MKRTLKRILIVFVIAVALIQIPFIYRRYQTGNLAAKITELGALRTQTTDPRFSEYKGIIHAHTSLGGHSTGNFDELIAGADQNGLDFVVMTEHYSDKFDTSALTLNGYYGNTLFVGGNEVDTADGDRFLMIPGSAEAANFRNVRTDAFLEKIHSEGRLALITYPEKFRSWDSNFDGVEAFSLHTNAKKMNPAVALLDLLWSFPAYPALTFATHFQRPDANLRRFDEISARRPITMFAGTDAHSNIGFHLFGDDAGNKLINAKIDGYGTIFQLARVHVLVDKDKPLTRESLVEALWKRRFFAGFDVLSDSSGFRFTADAAGISANMGDEMPLSGGMTLRASSPVPARFVFLRNGERFSESGLTGSTGVPIDQPGTYRVEVYLDQLGAPFNGMPWILSNPIYVR